jgi:hypothetical protein
VVTSDRLLEIRTVTRGEECRALEWWLTDWVPQGGRLFIDVGANIGTWTCWLETRFAYGHAIEPDPEALVLLRANVSGNVQVHPVAHGIQLRQFALTMHDAHTFGTRIAG